MRKKFLSLRGVGLLASLMILFMAAGMTPRCAADDDVDLRGLVIEVGPAPLSFNVNGTTITTTLSTDFDGDGPGFSSYADVEVGMQLDVRGFAGPGGSIVAERVKLKEPGSGREGGGTNRFRGVITSLELSSGTLTVNGLHIRVTPHTGIFDHEGEEERIPLSALTVGFIVQVGGTPLPSGEILAGKIELEEDDDDDHGGHGEHGDHGGHLVFNLKFKGRINFITTATQTLNINGKSVLTDSFTRFEDANENSIPFSAFVVGEHVEVKAIQGPDGSIYAVKIEKRSVPGQEVGLKGVIQGVDYIQRAIVINGHIVWTTSVTLILDRFNAPMPFEDLQEGQFVKVEGRRRPDGSFTADKIKLEDRIGNGIPIDEIRLKGSIQSLNLTTQSLTVRGHTILVTSATLILNQVKQPITLSQLQVGQFVQIEGRPGLDPQTIIATKIKREDGSHAQDGDDVIICGAVHPHSEVEHEIEHENEHGHGGDADDDDHGGHGGHGGDDRGIDKAVISVMKVGSWLVEITPETILTDRYGEPVALDQLQLGDFAIIGGTPGEGGRISARSLQREDQFFITPLAQAAVRTGGWMNYE